MDRPDPRDDGSQAESLGRMIKVYRTAWDMSRKDLAERSGLSYSYLAEIENGAKHPSTKALHLIANAFAMSPADLLKASEQLEGPEEPEEAQLYSAVAAEPSEYQGLEAPRGARARQRAWFNTELSSFAQRKPGRDSAHLKKLMLELQQLLGDMEPTDRERVLDLARRLREA